MFKRIGIACVIVFGCLAAWGQGFGMRMSGRLEGLKGDPGVLYVELIDAMGHVVVERASVAVDGSFGFDAPSGSYNVRVVTGARDEVIAEDYVQINPANGPLVLRMPQPRARERPVSGVVSVKDLQRQVPKKAWQAFLKAQQYSQSARPVEAMEQLRKAVEVDPDFRDAHSNLGVQLLKSGRPNEALGQFQVALRIGPASAMLYTNLAAALAAMQQLDAAESAVRIALKMDASNAKAQYLLGHMLAVQPGREKEALNWLMAAAPQIPVAKVVAANVLRRNLSYRLSVISCQLSVLLRL